MVLFHLDEGDPWIFKPQLCDNDILLSSMLPSRSTEPGQAVTFQLDRFILQEMHKQTLDSTLRNQRQTSRYVQWDRSRVTPRERSSWSAPSLAKAPRCSPLTSHIHVIHVCRLTTSQALTWFPATSSLCLCLTRLCSNMEICNCCSSLTLKSLPKTSPRSQVETASGSNWNAGTAARAHQASC